MRGKVREGERRRSMDDLAFIINTQTQELLKLFERGQLAKTEDQPYHWSLSIQQPCVLCSFNT